MTQELLIGKYVEHLPQVRRVFNLYHNRLEIFASWTFGKKYHNVIYLSDLSPEYIVLTVKNVWFMKSILIGSISSCVALVFSRRYYFDMVRYLSVLCWPIALSSFMVSILCFPKRHFVCLRRVDGKPGVDICRGIFNKNRFDFFLKLLHDCIIKNSKVI